MVLVLVPTLVQTHTFKCQIIPMANIKLQLFGRSLILPTRFKDIPLRVVA